MSAFSRWVPGFGVSLLLTVISLAGPSHAQELRGRLTGEVRDWQGLPLPGVRVTASSPALVRPQTVHTGADGVYLFPALPSGFYAALFHLDSFSPVKSEGLRIALNTTLTLHARMDLARVNEAITVLAETPVIDVKAPAAGTVFTRELLTGIPNARDIWAAMSQAPGYQMLGYDVGGSHAGNQTSYVTYGVFDQNKTLLEGINVTEATNFNAGYFDFGSLEEFQLSGAGNMGEQAGPGALLNLTVKSGGNRFHGQIYADYENDQTISDNIPDAFRSPGGRDGRGYKAPVIENPETGQNEGLQSGNPIEEQYDINLSLGGPIARDRLWFFVSYRDNNQYKSILGLPSQSAQSRLQNWTIKLNYQLDERNQLIGFVNERTKLQPLRDLSLTTPPESSYYQASKNRPMKLEWTSILSDRLFLDLQLGHWYNSFPLYPVQTQSRSVDSVPVGRIDLATDQRSGANNAYQDQIRNKPQISASLSVLEDRLGPGVHSFKAGIELQRDRREFAAFQPGDIYYRDRNGIPLEVDIWNTPNTSTNDAVGLGVYLQDSWSLSSRVTLNLGLRWDRYELGWPEESYVPNQSAYFKPVTVPKTSVVTLSSISPRIGIAWDLTGKGRTVWKTFLGQYYYNPSANVADKENPAGAAQLRYSFRDSNGNRILDGPEELGPLLSTLGGAGFVKVDRDIEHPYGLEASTHIEHELIPFLSARASYVFKGLRNEWAEVDLARVNAYTIPVDYVDAGPDGVSGTADDEVIHLFDRPRNTPSDRVFTNPGKVGLPGYDADYHTVEIALTRQFKGRWMLMTSFEHTWSADFRNPAQASTNSLTAAYHATAYLWRPNQRRLGRQTSTFWNYKLIGRHEFPLSFSVAASYKLQSGYNWARNATAVLPNAGSETVFTEPVRANRSPNVHIVDLRLEKAFSLGKSGGITVTLDVFNAFNSSPVTNFRMTTGARYKEVIAILDPRIFRLGARYEF